MTKLLKVEIDFSINSTQKILLEEVICSKPYFEKNPVIVKIKYPQVFEDRNGFIENLSILEGMKYKDNDILDLDIGGTHKITTTRATLTKVNYLRLTL